LKKSKNTVKYLVDLSSTSDLVQGKAGVESDTTLGR